MCRRAHIKGRVLGDVLITSYLNFSVECSKKKKNLKEIKYLLSRDEKYQQVHFHIAANLRPDGIAIETDLRLYTHTPDIKVSEMSFGGKTQTAEIYFCPLDRWTDGWMDG